MDIDAQDPSTGGNVLMQTEHPVGNVLMSTEHAVDNVLLQGNTEADKFLMQTDHETDNVSMQVKHEHADDNLVYNGELDDITAAEHIDTTLQTDPDQHMMSHCLPAQSLPADSFCIPSLPTSNVDVMGVVENNFSASPYSVIGAAALEEQLDDKQLPGLDGITKPAAEEKSATVAQKLLEKEVPGSTWKYKRLEVYHEKEIASVAHQIFPQYQTAEAALEHWQNKMLQNEYQGPKSEQAIMRLLHEPESHWQISLSLGIKNHGGSGEQQAQDATSNAPPTPQKRSYVLKICRLSDFMTKVHLQAGDRFCLYPGGGQVALPKEDVVKYVPEFYVEVQRGPPAGTDAQTTKEKRKRKRVKKDQLPATTTTPQQQPVLGSAPQLSMYDPVVGTNQVYGANAIPIMFSSVRRSGCFIDCFISSIPKFELGNISVIVPQDGRSIKIRAQWSGLTQLVDQQMMNVTLGDLSMGSTTVEGSWNMAHQHEINLEQFLKSNEMVTTNLQHQLDENTSWLVIRVPTMSTEQMILMSNSNQNHQTMQQQLTM